MGQQTDADHTMRCYGLEEPDSNWRVSVHGDDVFTAGVYDVQIFRIADGTVVHTVPEGAAELMSAVLHGDYVAMVLMGSTSSTEVFEIVSGKKLKLCHSEKRGRVESLAWVCQEESADSMPMLLEYCRTHGNDSWDAAEAIGTDPEGALYLWRLGSNLSDAECVCMCTLPTPPNPTDGEWVNAVMDVQGQNVLLMSCSGRCVYAFDISSLKLRYTRTLESLRDSLVSTARWNLGFMSPMSYYEGWTALPRNDGIVELWRSSTPGVGDDEHFHDLLSEEEHDYSMQCALCCPSRRHLRLRDGGPGICRHQLTQTVPPHQVLQLRRMRWNDRKRRYVCPFNRDPRHAHHHHVHHLAGGLPEIRTPRVPCHLRHRPCMTKLPSGAYPYE